MEDGHCMIDAFRNSERQGYFAIYDGHGGKTAVNYVQKHMHTIFEKALESCNSVEEAFNEAYRICDDELKEALYNGTTAITCYLHVNENTDNRILYTANCGDARVVINEGGVAKRLTFDHKASDASEVQRIKNSNGFVAYNRVNGILAVTRALGDYAMKQWVISEPYQTCTKLIPEEHTFVILACDGVWDVFEDQEAVNFVQELLEKEKLSAQVVAQRLLDKSLEKGSTDNISVMIIKF
jgi:serine/threonine protein phosphatase PrpC